MTIAEMEKKLILETLAKNKNNRSDTARELDISVRGLRYKLEKYGDVVPEPMTPLEARAQQLEKISRGVERKLISESAAKVAVKEFVAVLETFLLKRDKASTRALVELSYKYAVDYKIRKIYLDLPGGFNGPRT